MKKLFWFLLGFSLVAFPIRFLYADTCVSPNPGDLSAIYSLFQSSYGSNCTAMNPTVFSSLNDANIELGNYLNNTDCGLISSPYHRIRSVVGPSGNTIYGTGYERFGKVVFVPYYDGCPDPYNPDSDDDGIPDECDFYSDDPTPYQYRAVAGQADGSYTIYITDRGDYYEVGTWPGTDILDQYYPSSTWKTPTSACVGISDWSSTDPTAAQTPDVPYDFGTPDGSPDGGDPDYNQGTTADGSESAADQKIIANTKAIAENIAKQGAYFKDINASIQLTGREIAEQTSMLGEIDNSITGLGDQLTGLGDQLTGISDQIQAQTDAETARESENQADVDTATGDLNGVDVSAHYNSTTMPGTITAGEDYTEHGQLKDESFISDFLSGNPVLTAFDSSGFTLLNPVCSMTLDLGAMGSHELSLCEFQSEFQTAGVILFGLVSLGSLLIVARGF